MIVICGILICLTALLVFVNKTRPRNVIIVVWFIHLCLLILLVSPSHFESIIMILGVFLPFLTHFLSQGIGTQQNKILSLRPTGTSQVITILVTALLGSIILLQIYKNRALIDILWVPAELKNRTVYQFMSEYVETGLFIASVIVVFSALISHRITEGRES